MTEPRVYRRHLTQAKICRAETQAWMEREGFDWIDFMRNGVPLSALSHYDNVFIERVVAQVRREQEAQHGE